MWGQRSSRAKGAPSLQKTQMGWLPALPVRHPRPLEIGQRPDRDSIVHRSTFQPMSTAGLHIEARGCRARPSSSPTVSGGRATPGRPRSRPWPADHHVVTWDMRGHGRSEAPPGLYTREDALDDLGAVVDAAMAVAAGPALLVGHSLGGYFSLAYTLARPETVRGLALLSTGPGFRNPDSMAQVQPGRRHDGGGGGPGRQRRPRRPAPRLDGHRPARRDHLPDGGDLRRRGPAGLRERRPLPGGAAAHATLVEIDGAAHEPHVDRPDEVIAALRAHEALLAGR